MSERHHELNWSRNRLRGRNWLSQWQLSTNLICFGRFKHWTSKYYKSSVQIRPVQLRSMHLRNVVRLASLWAPAVCGHPAKCPVCPILKGTGFILLVTWRRENCSPEREGVSLQVTQPGPVPSTHCLHVSRDLTSNLFVSGAEVAGQ